MAHDFLYFCVVRIVQSPIVCFMFVFVHLSYNNNHLYSIYNDIRSDKCIDAFHWKENDMILYEIAPFDVVNNVYTGMIHITMYNDVYPQSL